MQNTPTIPPLPPNLTHIESFAIGLLAEDLKALRFYDDREDLGFDYTYFRPELGRYVVQLAGFADPGDDVLEFYYSLTLACVPLLEPNADSVRSMAEAVYHDLVAERERRAAIG